MFRLSKYELRKNRTALFVLLAGLAALQICFLIALRGKTQDYAIIWSTILVLYAVVCYFAVFIFAITNYYREINSKTSYLVFMTPVSALSIILSKMLTVLVLGVILAAALGALGWLDFSLFLNHYSVYKSMGEVISEVMKNFGIDTVQVAIVLSNRSKLKIEMMLDELLMKNPIVFMLQEEARHISFSYGVVEFGEMPGDIYTIIREADHRMYQCKTKNHSWLQKRENTI